MWLVSLVTSPLGVADPVSGGRQAPLLARGVSCRARGVAGMRSADPGQVPGGPSSSNSAIAATLNTGSSVKPVERAHLSTHLKL